MFPQGKKDYNISALVSSISHALTSSKYYDFSFFKRTRLICHYDLYLSICHISFLWPNFQGLTSYTERMVTRENCSLFPQPLATLVTHFPVTVSHSWGLINYLWPEIIWPRTTLNCLSHNIILSPVSGGFPKNYLFRAPLSSPLRSGLDWLLTPSPAYPSTQLCSWIFPRPLYEGLLSKS